MDPRVDAPDPSRAPGPDPSRVPGPDPSRVPGPDHGEPSQYEGNRADEQLVRERIEYPADQTDEG